MNDKLTINVNIAGRNCSLIIEQQEEENIRKAAQFINSKITQYRGKYANADPIDFLVATALQFTVKMLEAEGKGKEVENNIAFMIESVQMVNKRLDEFVEMKK